MKQTIIFAVLCLIIVPCLSQESPIRLSSQRGGYELMVRQIEIEASNEFFGDAPNSVENIEGSPYIPENFIVGAIYFNSELKQKNVLMRYNTQSDEIEIKTNAYSEDFSALIKDPEIYATVGNQTYIFAPYKGSIAKGGYFSVVKPGGHYDLYKKTSATLVPYKQATAYSGRESAKFEKTKVYYMVTKNGKFFELPNTKNRILKVMDEETGQIKDFIESRNLTFTTENDFVVLFDYYDSLISRRQQSKI